MPDPLRPPQYRQRQEIRREMQDALRQAGRYVPGPSLELLVEVASSVMDRNLRGILEILYADDLEKLHAERGGGDDAVEGGPNA